MTVKKRSFVNGAAILAVAGLIGKVIAAFYRVWLNALIGPLGLGIYAIPSSFYAFLLVVSTAGIPTAISKLVSESLAKGDERGAKEVFIVAVRFLLMTGALATLLMAALSGYLASAAGQPEAAPGFVALAPALLIVCLLSAYRGYFQGRQRMTPSAVSQIVEQIGRLVFGFGLAVLWAPKGAAAAATGAVLGVTLCELASLVMILGSYSHHSRQRPVKVETVRFRPIARRIFRISVPVTLGACIMPLVSLTDTMTVINRLTSTGVLSETATGMLGILNGMVFSIINMPAVITLSLSISLVPAISEALTSGDRAYAADTARIGVKLALLIGLPCAMGLNLLADPIMTLLSPSYTAWEHELAVRILRWMALAVMFLSVTQATTGILQGYGRPLLPVVSLGAGALVKVILNYSLIGMPGIGIMGAVAGSVTCYAVSSAINLYYVIRQSQMRFSPGDMLLKPFIAVTGMGVCVYAGWRFLPGMLGGTAALAACVGMGAAVYGALALLSGALGENDMIWLPGGRRLSRLLYRH